MINYYQWVPVVLLIQALLFYLPCLFWRVLNKNSGVDISNIVDAARMLIDSEGKPNTLRYMHRQMDRYLDHYKAKQGRFRQFFCGKRRRNFLVILYSTTKLLYIANVFLQIYILDLFISADFHVYGFSVFTSLLLGDESPANRLFPKSTMCDFQVRAMGNVHRHTVQCVLPINFFNEKIYLCVWIWFFLLGVLTLCDFIRWLYRFASPFSRIEFVRHYLRSAKSYESEVSEKVRSQNLRKFVVHYLCQDGVLTLRLLKANANGLAVAELIAELYNHFVTKFPFENGDIASGSDTEEKYL